MLVVVKFTWSPYLFGCIDALLVLSSQVGAVQGLILMLSVASQNLRLQVGTHRLHVPLSARKHINIGNDEEKGRVPVLRISGCLRRI